MKQVFDTSRPRRGAFGQALLDAADRRVLSLLLSLALVVAGWTAINLSRAMFVVEGSIHSVQISNRLVSNILRVYVLTDDRQMRAFAIDRACDGQAEEFGRCASPTFPVGSHIRFAISDFVRPAFCPIAASTDGQTCSPSLRPRRRWMQRLVSLEVDGRAVPVGWDINALLLLPYAYVAALAGVLAWHRWRIAALSTTTLLIFAAMFWSTALPVGVGLWLAMQ